MILASLAILAVAAGPDPDEAIATAPRAADAAVLAVAATADPVAPTASDAQSAAQAATQPAPPHGLTTDQQIAAWLDQDARIQDDTVGPQVAWGDDRRPHGEVSVSVGTGGYRDYAAAVSLPLGETGRLNLSVSQTENGYGAYPYGLAGGWGDYGPYGRYPATRPYGQGAPYVFDPGVVYPGPSSDMGSRRPSPPPADRPIR